MDGDVRRCVPRSTSGRVVVHLVPNDRIADRLARTTTMLLAHNERTTRLQEA